MRIRKHAKISPLLYTCSSLNSSAVTQTHVCQLNQSPWDVMTFPPEDPTTLPPPPPFLVDTEYHRSFMPNRTFSNHIPAQESPKKEKWDDSGMAEDRSRLKKEEEIILCSRTDKKGWQCGEKVKNGHSFCEHHLTKGKSNSVNAVVVHSKKSEENRRRAARSKKPASSSNPYEFYYYSGFGPRWGKKRGTGAGAGARTVVVKEEPYSSNESGSSSSSDTSSAGKNICNVDMEMSNSNTPEPNNVKVSIFSKIDNEGGVGYVEDEDEEDDDDDYEDDDDDNVEIGKKRVRKPIKARSLKSLM